jgi:hypothetical protein
MKSDTRKGGSKVEVIYILMALSSIKTCRDFYLMSVAVPDQKKHTDTAFVPCDLNDK